MKEIVGYTRSGSMVEVTWARRLADWKVVEVTQFLRSDEMFDCFAVLFALHKHLMRSALTESLKRGRALRIYLDYLQLSYSELDLKGQEAELGMKSPFEIVKYGRALLHPAFR